MMDLVTSYKEKLSLFRIKDLKDILTQLGVSKQGKKQDLVERILTIISDDRVSGMWAKKSNIKKEDVAKLVDESYRKLWGPGATNLESRSQNVSNVTFDTTFKEELEDTYQTEKVRCLCGSTLQTDSMIKCEDRKCNVRQHIGCVIIPEKPLDGILPTPPTTFYCELCRLAHADPFLVTLGHPLYPVKLTISGVPTDGTNPVQNVVKTFQLTRADRDLLAKPEFDIQAWCMLLNDKVSFRMQWPLYADLQVNGVPVRAINRPGSQLLGANGRDDGPLITPWIHVGSNKISLTGCDARAFCLGVRIVRKRTIEQILNLIPGESDGEKFEDALARVCRCVGGGAATENADSDSDLEVVSDCIPVNLRCPMSGSRMKIAGRFKPCAHMGCFDLEVFVQMNQRSRKWQCPICLKNYSLEEVIIDPYFTRITTKMRNCEEDVTEIEVKPDGCWRLKADNDRKSLGQLGQWHLPDGTLFVSTEIESKPKAEAIKQMVIHEGGSEGLKLKLGLKRNTNGTWEVSKHENSHSLSSERYVSNNNNGFPISSTATVSGRDGEDTSINQEGGGRFCQFTTDVADLVSPSPNMDRPAVGGVADVIVLSDSDEEAENQMSSGPAYNNNDTFSVFQQTEDIVGSSCLGPFNNNDDEDFWRAVLLRSTNQVGPDIEFLHSGENVHHGLGDPTSLEDFIMTDEIELNDVQLSPDSSLHQSNLDINDGLVDNPLAFAHNDPSLQLFPPTQTQTHPQPQPQPVVAEQVESTGSKGLNVDDWTSLQSGGNGDTGASSEPGHMNGNLIQQPPLIDGDMDALADTGSCHVKNSQPQVSSGGAVAATSLLIRMSDNKSGKTSRERSDNLFLFPRQKRSSSSRPRLYPPIQPDSHQDGNKSGKTISRERSNNPFVFPRRKRSARPRLFLPIQKDSDKDR